jgi:hypothetical protein
MSPILHIDLLYLLYGSIGKAPHTSSTQKEGPRLMKQLVYHSTLIALIAYIIYRVYSLYAALPLKVPSQVDPAQ